MLNDDFQNELIAAIPYARLYARVLTKWKPHQSENVVDDMVQESLKKAIEKKGSFEVGTNIKAWLRVIIKNTFLNKLKSHEVARTESLEIKMEHGFDIKGPGEPMETIALSEIDEFIDTLPEEERVIIRMFIEGMKYQEIADALGLTRSNVGVLLCRARHKIKAAFPDR